MEAKDTGRIRYVEPTSFFNNRIGTLSDAINFPYEDYCMAVDLSIKVTDRYSCGFGSRTGEQKEYNYSTQKGTISFLGGSKIGDDEGSNFLTTKYTDVSMTSPETNTSECLGIESITITYASWQAPQVVIRFVDVRGATVMMPNEQGYYNNSDAGIGTSIYKSFFTFPYPIFILKVKGFYGKGVTYRLSATNVSLEFDSNSGNFNIVATFIGHMYGVYADFPMTYLAIAPYTKEGREYWNKKIQDGTFRFRDSSGIPKENMLTIPELRLALARAANSEDSVSEAADGEQVQKNLEEQTSKIEGLISNFPLQDWQVSDDNEFLYHIAPSQNTYADLQRTVSGYVISVSGYDYTYGTTYLNSIDELKNYAQKKTDLESVYFVSSTGEFGGRYTFDDSVKNKRLYDEYVRPYDSVQKYIDENRGSMSYFYLYVLPREKDTPKYQDFINSLTSTVDANKAKLAEEERKYTDMKEQMIEKAIGFKPSIKNIYDLMFAHMETFMHIFYNMTGRIKDQLEKDKAQRAKASFSLNDKGTDTENASTKTSTAESLNVDARGAYLPPFTAFYKTNDDNGEKKKEMMFPDELIGGDNLEEVKFVNDLLAATQLYLDENAVVSQQIEEMTQDALDDRRTGNADTPSTNVKGFIPLTTYDFINKDNIKNPYDALKSKIFEGKEGLEGDIMGIFATRAFYYLATNADEGRREAKAFGVLEALNLFKSIGDKYSDNFINFIKKFADGSNERNESFDFIKKITSTDANDSVAKTWQRPTAPNIGRSLFTKSGNSLKYNYHKGFSYNSSEISTAAGTRGYVKTSLTNGTDINEESFTAEPNKTYQMFPLRFDDFNTLNKSYVNEKDNLSNGQKALLNERDFIAIDNINGIYKAPDNEKSSFKFFYSRDYIKNLFNSLESEVKAAQSSMAEDDDMESYSPRTEDQYGKIKRSNRTLRTYQKNIEDKLSNSSYSVGTIVDAEGNTGTNVRKAIATGSESERGNFYIKYPTQINENTLNKESLFDYPMYKMQKNIKAKAFLFLQSIPLYDRNKNNGISTKNENGVVLWVSLLKEGSYYWRMDNPDGIIFSDGDITYSVPALNETFCGVQNRRGKASEYDTLRMLTAKDMKRQSYSKWSEPEGVTPSRRTVLKKEFERWAESLEKDGFAANEARLTNPDLYEDTVDKVNRDGTNNDEATVFAKGLKIKDLAASERLITEATEAQALQVFLRNLFFSVCTTFDLYNGIYDNSNGHTDFTCSARAMRQAFDGFMEELNAIYGKTAKMANENPAELNERKKEETEPNPFKNTDIKLSTYITLKSLYDKWLCAPYYGPYDTWALKRNDDITASGRTDFDSFVYMDSYYHNIGYRLNVNVSKVSTWLSSCLPTSNLNTTEGVMYYTGKTIYEYLAQVAQDCGGVLLAMPQKFGLATSQSVQEMFTPMSINTDWDDDSSAFIFMYTYKPSEHLGESNPSTDMNGWSPEGDGFDLTDSEILGELFNDSGYTIPAFGVTFAKQNQSIFTNIKLNTENAGVTEAGLAATFNVASKSSESPRETTLYGQDLYRIFNQYAFKCSVESMGNMQITPLMYFQLNNIPFWHGAYQIYKVSHNITAGSITTSFEGMRLNRYSIPIADGAIITANDMGIRTGSESGGNGGSYVAGENGIVVLPIGDTKPNSTKQLKVTPTFDEGNVSEKKPIICLTPAHGPRTEKRREWEWSTKVVDEIAKILSKYKFYDGTSYSKNIQKCNKNGYDTTSSGYSMIETTSIIQRYGSKQVISVVPHWNGGAGKRHIIILNKYTNGVREDSKKLADCMLTEIKAVRDNRDAYTLSSGMPSGMMNGTYTIEYLGENNTDGAPQQNCACILTENWFADYPENSPWFDDYNYYDKDSNGQYVSGRGWLMSDTGIKVIAEAHAKAIKRYIDSL